MEFFLQILVKVLKKVGVILFLCFKHQLKMSWEPQCKVSNLYKVLNFLSNNKQKTTSPHLPHLLTICYIYLTPSHSSPSRALLGKVSCLLPQRSFYLFIYFFMDIPCSSPSLTKKGKIEALFEQCLYSIYLSYASRGYRLSSISSLSSQVTAQKRRKGGSGDFYQIGSSSDNRSSSMHKKAVPYCSSSFSVMEEEAAGRKDVFCSLRRQEELKMGMVAGDPWSC